MERDTTETQKLVVAYFRVSTRRQGESGLGLEGQETAVQKYVTDRDGRILARYTEVESGKNSDRHELQKALAHARRSRATLVVAKLDRLARNVAFLSTLMDGGVDFVACDNPYANRLTIVSRSLTGVRSSLCLADQVPAPSVLPVSLADWREYASAV